MLIPCIQFYSLLVLPIKEINIDRCQGKRTNKTRNQRNQYGKEQQNQKVNLFNWHVEKMRNIIQEGKKTNCSQVLTRCMIERDKEMNNPNKQYYLIHFKGRL